jgi:hypothetical protein
MNIDELLNDLVITSEYKEQIVNFNNIQKHIHTEDFSYVEEINVQIAKLEEESKSVRQSVATYWIGLRKRLSFTALRLAILRVCLLHVRTVVKVL